MTASKYASYNGKQKVSCWTVSAPQSIARNGHDIIFRRVNPYNEDEVWNYWHAGPVAGNGSQIVTDSSLEVYSIALSTTSTTNDTISFTAFADGSPLPTMSGLSGDDVAAYKAPAQSCGGLWGNHNVRTLTVYDGLPGQPLKNGSGDLSSVLTIRYNYQYKVGNNNARLAQIEYKSSGPEYNSFYYFIVPDVAYAAAKSGNDNKCAFKLYTGYNSGYAINSAEKNSAITFVDYYGEDSYISGDYFELNQKTDGTDYSYWGSDLLYVQTNADTKNIVYTSGSANDSNAKLLQVFFTANSDFSNRSSANNRFVYLYYNGNFSSSDGTGFACVVPNDKEYARFRIENCNYNGTTRYNVTDSIPISSASNVAFTDTYTNSSYNMKVKYLTQNGVTLTYIGATVYLRTTHQSYGNDPHAHFFNSSGGSPDTLPGYMMHYTRDVNSNNLKEYYVEDGSNSHNEVIVNVSKYNGVSFKYYGGNYGSADFWMNMNDVHNGMVFQSDGGNGNVGLISSRSDSNNNTLRFLNDWTSADWPHLTFQS